MNATWKQIDGFDGYAVSDSGLVMNTRTGKILKPKSAGKGYQQVCLPGGSYRYIHRLVAHAFISNEAGQPQVNHLDGNKANNAAANLEWCTAAQNLQHAYASGLLDESACKKPVRGASHRASRPVCMESDTGHISITFVSIREAAQAMGIDYSTVHGAAHGKFKHAGGWRFGFAN